MVTTFLSDVVDENQLIKDNMGLVIKIVKSFNPSNPTIFDEYVQAGRIGLLSAIRLYDENRGAFTTIAWNHIRWSILKYIKKEQSCHVFPITVDPSGEIKENITDYFPSTLSDRERNVILQHCEGNTFKDIGEKNGYSKSWANYVFHSGIKKIQKANEGIYD